MDLDKGERNRRLYFKNLRKKQKRRRAERKREERKKIENEKAKEQLGGTQEFKRQSLKNYTVTAAQNIDEIEIEKPAKKPHVEEDEDREKVEEHCSGFQASKALQLAGKSKCSMEQGEKPEEPQSTKPPAKRTQEAEKETLLRKIDPNLIKPLGKTIGSGTFGICKLAQYRDWTVVVKEFRAHTGNKEKLKREV